MQVKSQLNRLLRIIGKNLRKVVEDDVRHNLETSEISNVSSVLIFIIFETIVINLKEKFSIVLTPLV